MMKNKNFMRFIALIATLCALMSTASAAKPDDIARPQYDHIGLINAALKIDSSGYAKCSCTATPSSSYTAKLTMDLQRSSNGRNWVSLDSWTASGSDVVSFSEGRYVTSGYTYRVRVTARIYTSDGSLAETESVYSVNVEY